MYLRSEIVSHEDLCPQKVVACSHQSWGCDWKGIQQDSDSHLSQCSFEKAAPLLSTLERAFSDLRAENVSLRARMDRMEEEKRELAEAVGACQASLGEWLVNEESEEDFTLVETRSQRQDFPSQSVPNLNRSQSFPTTSTSAPASTSSHFPSHFGSSFTSQDNGPAQVVFPQSSISRTRSMTMDQESSRRRRSSSSSQNRIPASNALSSTLSSLQASIASLSAAHMNMERRSHEEHLASMNTGFEVGRAHEELGNLRHGLHAVRMQMHSVSKLSLYWR